MDPEKALRDFIDAIDRGDTDDAIYCARDLERWIQNGGFLPRGYHERAKSIQEWARRKPTY